MKKSELRELLANRTEEFLMYGGEVVRYASPSNPVPIKFAKPPGLPTVNMREEAWRNFIEQLISGTYAPDRNYQDPPRKRLKPSRAKHPALGPQWRNEIDYRGYRTK